MEEIDNIPDIGLICSRLNAIITTCNDGLKGLTSRPESEMPKTDLEKICYCSKTGWAEDGLNKKLTEEMNVPCSTSATKTVKTDDADETSKAFDVADIRGPCGKNDCDVARNLRFYIEDLVDEDDTVINLNELVGPCGRTDCNFIKNMKDFILHRGAFAYDDMVDKPKQCTCTEEMEKALVREGSCDSICSHDCVNLESILCGGKGCVHKSASVPKSEPSHELLMAEPVSTEPKVANELQNIQSAYYVTVKLDDKPASDQDNNPSSSPKNSASKTNSETKKPSQTKFKHCAPTCPTSEQSREACSKSACNLHGVNKKAVSGSQSLKCIDSKCPNKEADFQEALTPSPDDSDIEINLAELRNPCCVKSCKVADQVVDYIVQGLAVKPKCTDGNDDSCFCDCTDNKKQ